MNAIRDRDVTVLRICADVAFHVTHCCSAAVTVVAADNELKVTNFVLVAQTVLSAMDGPTDVFLYYSLLQTLNLLAQIVSSAVVNAPPPQTFMKLLHKANRSDLVAKPQTREKMVHLFKGRLTGDKLLAQRYNILPPISTPHHLPLTPKKQKSLLPPHQRLTRVTVAS